MVHNVTQTVIEGLLVFFYLYVLFIIIISKAKTFKNAFYSIFVASGITDVASLLAGCYLRLNQELSLGEDWQNITRYFLLTTHAALISHLIGNMLITINRYSALRYLHRYDLIWTRKNVFIAIIVQYAVSFAAFAHIIVAKLIYVQNKDGTVNLKSYEVHIEMFVRLTLGGACTIYVILSIILDAKLFVEWKRISKMDASSRHRHHDKRLLMHTTVVFLCTLLMCIVQLSKAVATFFDINALNIWLIMQYYWINDLMLSASPFSLLLLSSDLRQEIVNSFRRKKVENTTIMSVTTRTNRTTVVRKF
ncbi:hypothetical protein V3C99_007104 [Haemonchus contortus]